ncbi:acetyltransferase [Paenibacillus popilliae]|uniref:acetyltransferase n=1 Tax=Paenibacillus popilliae TaxID=78057 RepID=UPI00131F234D|nr:acetyltransferase [Paenibacillus popilliae]
MCPQKVIIIGGGGHAKVVIDVFNDAGRYEIFGFTSPSSDCDSLCGASYLGSDDKLISLLQEGVQHFCIALGDNLIRRKLFNKLVRLGFTPVSAISSAAYVSPYAQIGRGTVVMPGATINAYAVIGDNVIINTRAGIDHDCRVDSHVHIAPGVSLAGSVYVNEGAFLGIGCNVIPNIHIGEWSVIGAGATVISNISSKVTAVGVPAKIIS